MRLSRVRRVLCGGSLALLKLKPSSGPFAGSAVASEGSECASVDGLSPAKARNTGQGSGQHSLFLRNGDRRISYSTRHISLSSRPTFGPTLSSRSIVRRRDNFEQRALEAFDTPPQCECESRQTHHWAVFRSRPLSRRFSGWPWVYSGSRHRFPVPDRHRGWQPRSALQVSQSLIVRLVLPLCFRHAVSQFQHSHRRRGREKRPCCGY